MFTEMARAGRITEPGRGLYSIPVASGLINVVARYRPLHMEPTWINYICNDELKGERIGLLLQMENQKHLKHSRKFNWIVLYCSP